MNDTTRNLDETLVRPLEKALDEAKKQDDAKVEPKDDDDIARIERRMEARRVAIREHFTEARLGVERTAKSWPVVAVGAVVAAIAVGYVVAQRVRPSPSRRARTAWDKVREAPDAARAYVHRATRPASQVWGERLAAGTGMAMAVLRALPQLRALAEAMPRGRTRHTHRRAP
jgi:hypothetical protein